MTRRQLFRWVGLSLLLLLAVAIYFLGQSTYLWTKAWFNDRPAAVEATPNYVDDASRMNRTHVAEVWPIPHDPAVAEEQLRELLDRAKKQRLPVAIGGARHTMGGHTIYPEGIVIDMLPFNNLECDVEHRMLHAGAGARWSQVIPYLDACGLSVAVMQANNDFSIGGSLSVNCHGWQPDRPPISSTVESFRLMLADGSIVHCSRHENAELFSLALGGYGLFGVILDADLHVVPNERYTPEVARVPADEYVARFAAKVDDNDEIGLAYGRLCVVPGDKTFLREALLTVFRRTPCPSEKLPKLSALAYRGLRREVFRAQIGSDAGKQVRWNIEKKLGEQVSGEYFSRNQLLDEGTDVYGERNAERTDIVHEYFVSPRQVPAFLAEARAIIPKHHGDLLNVTIRNVLTDNDTRVRYADQPLFAFVMLFSQLRTAAADEEMAAMTRDLIDAAIDCGGRYYLPYRPHATPAQFMRDYPAAAAFFERKRHYDPDELFRNEFYQKYGR